MSHYGFRYSIVLAWFDALPKCSDSSLKNKKRQRDDFSSITPNSSATFNKRAKHINDTSLDPVSGSLREHLGADFHYIEPSKAKDPACSLCRWAHSSKQNDWSERIRGKSVGACNKFGINLCLKCFKIFQTIGNVKKLKAEVILHAKPG